MIAFLKERDWLDIGLHVAAQLLITLLGHYALGISLFALCLASIIFWLGREIWQHWPDWKEVFTRPQPLLEWLAPVAVGIVVSFFIGAPL